MLHDIRAHGTGSAISLCEVRSEGTDYSVGSTLVEAAALTVEHVAGSRRQCGVQVVRHEVVAIGRGALQLTVADGYEGSRRRGEGDGLSVERYRVSLMGVLRHELSVEVELIVTAAWESHDISRTRSIVRIAAVDMLVLDSTSS